MENYDHYITKMIRRISSRRMLIPTLYLLLLITIWSSFPLTDIIAPKTASDTTFSTLYKQNHIYINCELKDLHFTGYTQTLFGNTSGYYYYGYFDKQLTFVLLSPKTCEEGLSEISSLHVKGKILYNTDTLKKMISHLADDVNWSTDGIHSEISNYYLSEPELRSWRNYLFIGFFFLSGIYSLTVLFRYMLYCIFPITSPPCRQLGAFGKPSKLLEQAEEELATLPQLATEDMFITEHYFIETSKYGIAIVPINEILWVYKYSTLHKIFWYHFSISYTLHITANRHMHIHCPKNIKSDIDGIIDYLAEANHDIRVGFSEENRVYVQKLQHANGFADYLLMLIKRHI